MQIIKQQIQKRIYISLISPKQKIGNFIQSWQTQNNNKRKFYSSKIIGFYCNSCQAVLFYRIQHYNMTDEQLFRLIRKAVRDRKSIPTHSDTQTFAERYCEQQMAKKKFNHHTSQDRMNSLMKNFTKLQTYFDLPELLSSINMIKAVDQPNKSNKATNKLVSSIRKSADQKESWKKHLTEMKNLHFVVESQKIKSIINEFQQNNNLQAQTLKNNSIYNMDIICDKLATENDTTGKNSQVFTLLKVFKEDEERFIHRQVQTSNQNNPIKSKEKKDYKNFLHKVSSYLQIALEMEHRSKWKTLRQRRSTNLKKSLPNFIIMNKLAQPKNSQKQKQNIPLRDFSNTDHSGIHNSRYKFPKNKACDLNSVLQKGRSRFFVQSKTKSSQTVHEAGIIKPIRPSNNQIRQTFTFRRRSVKQRIIKRLDQFIGDIDEESHGNHKQNKFYCDEINKLQNQYTRLYSRYRRQTLAGDKDIENLKKLASQIQFVNPFRRASRQQNKGMVMGPVSQSFSPSQETYI